MIERCKLTKLARSQLEHVLIALRDGDRAYNVRDVLDPWWCYERGGQFVSEGSKGYRPIEFNKPCAWKFRDVLPQFDWMSTGADAIIAMGEAAKIVDRRNHPNELRLIVDHSVPLRVICDELWRRPAKWTAEGLRDFLKEIFRRAVISYRENCLLDSRKLNSKMPSGWRFGDDPFARYADVGIGGRAAVVLRD